MCKIVYHGGLGWAWVGIDLQEEGDKEVPISMILNALPLKCTVACEMKCNIHKIIAVE